MERSEWEWEWEGRLGKLGRLGRLVGEEIVKLINKLLRFRQVWSLIPGFLKNMITEKQLLRLLQLLEET